jgi:hypothetical protein
MLERFLSLANVKSLQRPGALPGKGAPAASCERPVAGGCHIGVTADVT